MRKIGSILFVCLYLISYTEVHQLFSVPALLEHYHEHRIDNAAIGLIEFIALHYTRAEHRHDNSGHEELPFKDDHCLHALNINPIYFTEVSLKEFCNRSEDKNHNSQYSPDLVTWQLHHSIWQPPRI
jgi:hypothetical protein